MRQRANKRRVWLTLCKQTRQVAARPGRCRFRQDAACVVGGRGIASCRQLWQAIPEDYEQGTCFTDFWDAYQAVIPDRRHEAVGKETGLTHHVKHFNNTIRQRLARFVRKTLSFSKADEMHLTCLHLFLHLFLHRYNLERAAAIRQWATTVSVQQSRIAHTRILKLCTPT